MPLTLNATQRRSQISILRRMLNAARHLEKSVKVVPGTSRQKRLALMIFHDLTNKIESIYELCRGEHAAGPEIIARSAFENYVDLLNTYKHPQRYTDYLLYISAEHQRKGLLAIINTPDSPYSQSIIKNAPVELGITIEQMLDSTKQDLARNKLLLTAQYRRPHKRKSVNERNVDTRIQHRAKLAGKKDEYEAMYRLYSRPAHGEIGSMLGSFVDGDRFVWPPKVQQPSSLVVDTATRMILDAGKILCQKLKRPSVRFRDAEKRRENWANQFYRRS